MSASDNTPSPSENVEHWIDAARHGSADALGQVLAYCRPYLLAVANDQLETDLQAKVGASDLVHETFLEALRDFPKFRGSSEQEVLGWLRQILLHNVANVSRQYRATDKRQIQREVVLGEAPAEELLQASADDGSSPSARALRRERDEALALAMEQLSEEHRQVIQLRSYERCSFKEVGRRMRRSEEAARKLWARAIERLQLILGPADESR